MYLLADCGMRLGCFGSLWVARERRGSICTLRCVYVHVDVVDSTRKNREVAHGGKLSSELRCQRRKARFVTKVSVDFDCHP